MGFRASFLYSYRGIIWMLFFQAISLGRIAGYRVRGPSFHLRSTFATKTGSEAASCKVLVPVASGTEEIEAVTIIDTLVRAGVEVTVASVEPDKLQVVCSRGVKLVADTHVEACVTGSWDLIACPGGMPGAEHLRDSPALTDLLKRQYSEGKFVAAICAAPAVVLSPLGFISGRTATGYPAPKFIDQIENYSKDRVVVDGNVVTSQGPGTALVFSLKLVEVLCGLEMAQKLEKEMLA